MFDLSVFLTIIFLVGSVFLTGLTISLYELGRIQSKRQFYKKRGIFFFYFLLKRFFPKEEWDDLFFLISAAKQIIYLSYVASAFFLLFSIEIFQKAFEFGSADKFILHIPWLALGLLIIAFIPLILNFCVRPLANIWPRQMIRITAPFAFLILVLLSPITFLLLKIQKLLFSKKRGKERLDSSLKLKYKIMELVHESEISNEIEPRDQKLITSVVSFRDRIVKEIMVPRIDIVALSSDQTIEDAAGVFMKERYSRLPIFRDDVDHIVGVLLYKDILAFYLNGNEPQMPSASTTTIETLLKPILYTPETKKISHLLQEFKNKQIHLAIVVDEYGGTEGIVTIEDILEEIVGEISDEYDFDEEVLFIPLANGGWIVDAKMNILDIEKKLGIKIPPGPEYESIGGYVYHIAGSIPSKGWRIHHDFFDLEVLSSNERGISKIRIIPTKEDSKERA